MKPRSILASLCACGWLAGAAATPQPTSFPAGVELVTVDAVVLDRDGQPVRGLTREDFVLTEDGRPLEIASFEAIALAPAAGPAEPAPAVLATNQGRPATGRAFALLLDDLALTPDEGLHVKSAVTAFVTGALRDGDEVLLASTSGDASWTARIPEGREDLLAVLGRIQGRYLETDRAFDQMSPYEAFEIANRGAGPRVLDRVVQRWIQANLCPVVGRAGTAPSCPALVATRAQELDGRRRQLTAVTLAGVRRAIEALGGARGRKSVLLFSRGFLADSDAGPQDVAAAARRANAAVYFVDARGLVAQSPFQGSAYGGAAESRDVAELSVEDRTLSSAGSQDLADETGGFSVRNSNDLAAGSRRIADESSAYYLLGFHPPEGKPQDAWRKLRVEVARPGLSVRARRGYSLRAEAARPAPRKSERGPDPAVARALESAHDAGAIPLRVMAYVLEPRPKAMAHVIVAVELDASRIPRPDPRRAVRLDVSVVATERDSGKGFRHDDVVELKADAAEASGWRALAREFELPEGVQQARVVVHDLQSGALGSVSYRFEVPRAAELRLSTPILSDHAAPAANGQPPQPAIAVHRTFPPGARLYCQFEVFGATRQADQAARVLAGAELRTAAGALLQQGAPTPIAASAGGRLVRTLVLDLAGRSSGAYELLLQVQDEASGARVTQRERFEIAEGAVPEPSK